MHQVQYETRTTSTTGNPARLETIPAMMDDDSSFPSMDDTRGGLVSLPNVESLLGSIHTVAHPVGDYVDDETMNALPPQPSFCHYTENVGHRYKAASRHRTSRTSKPKLTFPSLTVSVTMQTYWAQRNRRRYGGRFSITSCLHRNRRLPLLISFTCFVMTISSLSSMLLLKKQQLQYSQQQSATVPHRSLEQQHQQQHQLYRRRQLRTSSKPATAVISNAYAAHYLSFGSLFATEGSASQPMKSKNDFIPYPYLLDANVQLVAVPSILNTWSPYSRYVDFVAACTQSLVDGTVTHDRKSTPETPTKFTQQIPDVITIEYTLETDLTKGSYLVLIQRLRQRYPNAVIVLVQLLQDPSKYLHLVEASSNPSVGASIVMNFQQWISNPSLSTISINSKNDLIQAMYQTTMDGESLQHSRRYWAIIAPPTTANAELSKLLESDAQILHYTNPLWQTNLFAVNASESKEHMKSFWNHFSFAESDATATSIGLSLEGHMSISSGVRMLVEEHIDTNKQIDRKRPTGYDNTGDWGSGDDCHIWYTNGDYGDVESIGGRTVDVPTVTNQGEPTNKETILSNIARYLYTAFSSKIPHKHALEFSRPKPSSYFAITSSNKNYVVVNNPFRTPRLLSLSYLTDSDGMSYPKTLIVLNDVPSVQIQPIHELSDTSPIRINNNNNLDGQLDQHVAKTSSVGYIPPGKSMLRFIPLQNTILPFRLVGVSILAEELQHSTEYAFEMDVTTVSVTDVIQQ